MRIVSLKALRLFWRKHADAEGPLRAWFEVTRVAEWRSFAEVRQTFRRTDVVRVSSGNTVTVFDVGGNKYRLVAAIHFNTGVVYALLVMTHKEYSLGRWKSQL
jgi:mRNA interferase HigB